MILPLPHLRQELAQFADRRLAELGQHAPQARLRAHPLPFGPGDQHPQPGVARVGASEQPVRLTYGALDTTFGDMVSGSTRSGWTATDLLTGSDAAMAMRLQTDGRIVLAGYAANTGSATDMALARYLPSGELDNTFDSDGKVTVDLGSADTAYALAIGPDLKITLAGRSGNDFGLARVNIAADLDRRLYVQQDASHNVTSISDTFGQPLQRFIYDPQGGFTRANGGGDILGPTEDPYEWDRLFQGKRWDAFSEDFDFDARRYRPGDGRFGSVDPLLYVDGANTYRVMRGKGLRQLQQDLGGHFGVDEIVLPERIGRTTGASGGFGPGNYPVKRN